MQNNFSEQQRPNILWICTDQQRFDTLGCYHNPYVNTPNIDRLAEMGVLFERSYCQNPVCAPSRASFLTGRYPRTCGVRQNGQMIPENEKLVTKLLADEGYVCGLSGKLHIAPCNQSVCKVIEKRIDDGYTEFHWSHHPDRAGRGNWVMNEYSNWLVENGIEYKTPPFRGSVYVQEGMLSEYHQTTWCVNKAIDFINKCSMYNKPWMFSVNMFDPHHPFDPPIDSLERYIDILDEIPLPNYVQGELENKPVFQQKDHGGAYDTPGLFNFTHMTDEDHKLIRAAYWAMVDHIDTQVGRLLDLLEKTNQLENTIIIFTSDHGEMLGDHGIYLKGPYFYECGIHIPLIIAWPGVIEGGRRSKALVELVDIAPTLMEAAGLEIYKGMQGKSLWGLLKGQKDLHEHRKNIYCEYYNSNIKHRDPFAHATMIFDGRYKLARYHSIGSGELYDLEKDPNEFFNRWNDPDLQYIKIKLLEELSDRMAFTCDPLPERQAEW